MKLYLEVKADTNDADYVHERSEISEELLEQFKPLITAIKNGGDKYHHQNWCTSEYSRGESPDEMYSAFGDLVDTFGEFVPHGEHGVHTIAKITLLKVESEEILL